MSFHQALSASAFAGFSDELIAYFTLFCEQRELLRLSEVNSVLYVFCQEDPLWMVQCLRLHNGDFSYHHNWKLTTFYPRDPRPLEELEKAFRPVSIRGFSSDFLYRRWLRCHLELGDAYLLPSEEQDATIRRLQKIDIRGLSYQDYFEQYARIPFVLCNAIGKWKAMTEWTAEKLAHRFSSDTKLRITHNLEVMSESLTMEMNFADYFKYANSQHDETPLYIFDPEFGEKMPDLLQDYNIEDLMVFKEDFLSVTGMESRLDGNNKLRDESGKHEDRVKSIGGKTKKRDTVSKRADFRWIVIGPQRTGASWHQDPVNTSAWNSLVKGRKRWAIYPPNVLPPGISKSESGGYFGSGMDMSSLMWYLHVYPTLTSGQKPLEVIQEEGDTIYVPNGWWHLVLNLDNTIAVTQNFVDSHNAIMFMKDLFEDGQDDKLAMVQHKLRATRPETYDIFRVAQIPRVNGYLSEEMFQQTFHVLEYWKPQLKRILKRHKLLAQLNDPAAKYSAANKVKYPKMKCLTSRVNPTFAVGKRLIIKFFSQYNNNWGEFDFETYMTPNFDVTDVIAPTFKRHKRSSLQPCELKRVMSLRYAMEESFRIEKAVYEMIEKSTSSNCEHHPLHAMISRLCNSGHLLYLDEVDSNDEDESIWRWPYIVIEYVNNDVSLKTVKKMGGATRKTWLNLAKWISQDFLPRLHSIPIDSEFRGVYGHDKAEWGWYVHFLLRQRKRSISFHLTEFGLPAHLMRCLENFLPAANSDAITLELLPVKPFEVKPVLLHGDLTDENILGSELNDKRSNTLASSFKYHALGEEVTNLTSFLTFIGCEKYISLLVNQEEMELESLALLEEAHLEELGIPLGPRLAILQGKQLIMGKSQACTTKREACESNGYFNCDEEWELSSSSSKCSEEDNIGAFTTPTESTILELKRKEPFNGPIEWLSTSVIDFADAKTGDPLYDLVAVFFAALHCDRDLWKETLAAEYWQNYICRDKANGTSHRRCLQERFLQLVLLHPSQSVKNLFHYFPQASNFATWEDVAREIFNDLF
ncbi:hypothetical protein CCR75_002800 [Bremia lactucae]|uniref:JmjC domain-containing protein n=1 Tax=Bremia lactucae TaxID=4779 RepID=A0A976FQI7_BRELC|nr:hypothetical protein CCR75_002800 [Bremia lactucae]